jgi:hypothetical protein
MKKIVFFLLLINLFYIGIAQVSLQTGSANYSLPIFNWQDQKSRLNSSVSINYTSGNGLKTNEVASNLGQGWNLQAGGVITRTQVGEPDDQKPRNTNDLTKYPSGYLYNTKPIESGAPVALTKYPLFEQRNQLYKQHNSVAADRELDQFSYQFNGRSGVFVLDPVSNKGVSLGDTKMQIDFELEDMPNTRTTIKAFNIKDENGLIFRFKNFFTKVRVLKNSFCDASLNRQQVQPKFENGNVYHESFFPDASIVNEYIINSWHLAEIEDALTGRKITFNYTPRMINTVSGIDIMYNGNNNYAILSHKKSDFTTQELSSILYPDGHTVTLNYGKDRIDLPGAKALASIDVLYQGRYLSKHQLNTTYVILNRYGTPRSPFQQKAARLYLRSVVQYSADLKGFNEPYTFDYFLGSSIDDDFVPMPFSPFKDIWGNYNGNYSLSATGASIDVRKSIVNMSISELKGLCFLRDATGSALTLNPKSGYAKNGLLKQIVYPTGGTLRYDYTQNYGQINGQNREVNGVHVAATYVTDGGFSHPCNNPLTTNYNYSLENSNNTSLWGIEMPKNDVTGTNFYEAEGKYWKYKIPFGTCKYRYQYPGIQSIEQASDLSWLQNLLISAGPILEVISSVTTVTNVISLFSKGSGFGAILGVVLDVIAGIYDIISTCFTSTAQINAYTNYYNYDLNGSNSLPTQFKRVEMVNQNGGAGKTVVEFTSDVDYPIWVASNAIGTMEQRFAYWAYGLPKTTIEYNATGNKVKETINIYNFNNAKRTFASPKFGGWGYPSCKAKVKVIRSQRITDWNNPTIYETGAGAYQTGNTNDMDVKVYDVYTGITQLQQTKERVYKTSNPSDYLESVTNYEYNSNNYQVNSIHTTQSNGDQNWQEFTYNDNINVGILNTLVNNNIIGIPVIVTTRTSKVGDGSYNLSEKVTEFTTLSNGDIKPSRILEQRADRPQNWQNWGSYLGPNNPANSTYYKEIETFTYDAANNLVGIKDEGGHTVANIYDYNDKYIVASVINTVALADKPAYTSFETTSMGGWLLNGTSGYQNTGVTGSKSFLLSGNNNLQALINNSKSYKLSFWSSTGVNVSNGASLVKSAPTINGFTFYEYSIPSGNASITITGNATIDELRLYPANARMRTVSYDPLIGKTAECDENNRITYYEYDELSRLRFIKDDYLNIIKMNEYNTIKNPAGCITTYTNLAVTETFTKNNCGSGFEGSTVTYTIPANKYSSTVSQEAVDQMVQQELNSLSQAFANSNGACIQLFYNTAQSESFIPEACGIGYTAANVTYIVPANVYVSRISQADADLQALKEIKANGQNYANANANCVVNNNPVWEAEENAATQCEKVGGWNTGNILVWSKDVNPNSASYNTYQWINMGPGNGNSCPVQTNLSWVTGTNNSSETFEITFSNFQTNTFFSMSLGQWANQLMLQQIPEGTYDITITPINFSTNSYFYSINGANYFWGSGGITWFGIQVGSSGVQIQIN